MRFTDSREFFEAAREASRDAERIRRQLAAMEDRATATAGGGFEPRVRSTPDPDRIGRSVSALVDRESMLRERQEDDYRLIEAANRVLYGETGRDGLWALVGWRADALAQHYLNDRTWSQVGDLMGYTEQHVWQQAQVALEVCDGWGMVAVVAGRGGAENG